MRTSKRAMPTKKVRTRLRRWGGGNTWLGIPLNPAIFILAFACIGLSALIITKAQGYETGSNSTQLTYTNNYRASHGLTKLKSSGCLTDIANRWAYHMAVSGTLHHTDGKAGSTVVHTNDPGLAYYLKQECTSGGTWSQAGENVGVTSGDSVGLFNSFVGSPGHLANIKNSRFDLIGVGSYRTSAANGSKLYMTVLFADCNGCSGAWTAAPEAKAKPTNPYVCNEPYPVLKAGSTQADCIKNLQWLLNYTASQSVAENGTYDSSTAAAVKNIEKFFGISPVDGIADQKVWDVLHYVYSTR